MISPLYSHFIYWSIAGSVYLISDTHFGDECCKLIDPNWPSPQEQVDIINKTATRSDTLILLGDVGNPQWIRKLKAKIKVLITGNHDSALVGTYFNEVYEGPLMISKKILLSHEPIYGLEWCVNIHGHNHQSKADDPYHFNCATNLINYTPVSLGKMIKEGLTSSIKDIHRITIDKASE